MTNFLEKLSENDKLFAESVGAVFHGTKFASSRLEDVDKPLSLPPEHTWIVFDETTKSSVLLYLASSCFTHATKAIAPNVRPSADQIRNQLSLLLLDDSAGILASTVIEDSRPEFMFPVVDIPCAELKLRRRPPQPLVYDRERKLLWHLALLYLRHAFQLSTGPPLTRKQIKILMNLAIEYLQDEQTRLTRFLLTTEDLHKQRAKAILGIQYLQVDDRHPATLQEDGLTISPEVNERRANEVLSDLINNRFDELWSYVKCFLDFNDHGPQPITAAKAELLYRCYKFCYNAAWSFLQQLLIRDLIVKMPSYTYDRDSKQIKWKFIEYRDGIDWLDKCLNSQSWLKVMLALPINPNAAQVCWPGDIAPIIEPLQRIHRMFTSEVTTGTFSGKPYHISELCNLQIFDGEKLSVHHVIGRNLLLQLWKIFNELQQRHEAFPQITHRLENVVSYNNLKIWSASLTKRYMRTTKGSDESEAPDDIPKSFRLYDPEQAREHFGRSFMWCSGTGGNLFTGPSAILRGPFDPSKRKSENNFETDAESILGAQRYSELYKLYIEIQDFVNLKSTERTYDKAEELRLKCHYLFSIKYKIIRFDETQWIKRRPTADELNKLTGKTKKKYNNSKKLYWAIK